MKLPLTKHRILSLIALINIFLILLALDRLPWVKWLAITPWLLAIIQKGGLRQIRSTIKENKTYFLLSLTISLLIYSGCWDHHCKHPERMSFLIPLIWVPIASTVKYNLHQNGINGYGFGLLLSILSAISVTTCALIWQFFFENQTRPIGFSHNVLISPMLMGMTCTLFMLRSKCLQSGQNSHIINYLSGGALLLAITGSMVTLSKTGLLVFVFATAIRLVTTPSERKRTLLIALPIIALWAFVISNTLNVVRVDIQKYESGGHRTSLGERLDAIKWATDNILKMPLLGIGKDKVELEFNQRWRDWGLKQSEVSPMPHLHNDYLQIALAYGVIAASCFILYWVTLATRTAKTLTRGINDEAVLRMNSWFLTLISIFMLAFMLDSFTYWTSTWLMISASIGIGLGVLSSESPTSKTSAG